MPTFTNISKKRINFDFQEPKTGEEILKEIEENQKKYGYDNQYKIVENQEENDLIKSHEEKRKQNVIQEVKEISKSKDFKEAKVKKNFSTEIEKSFEGFTVKKNGIFEITSEIPNVVLVKKLLPLTKDISEKKKIVSEENNLAINKAKESKSFVEILLNGKNYKVKFI